MIKFVGKDVEAMFDYLDGIVDDEHEMMVRTGLNKLYMMFFGIGGAVGAAAVLILFTFVRMQG